MQYQFELCNIKSYYHNTITEKIKQFFEQNPNQCYWEKDTSYAMGDETVTLSHCVIKRERKEKYPFVIKKTHQSIEEEILYFTISPMQHDVFSYTVISPAGKKESGDILTKDIPNIEWKTPITLKQLNQAKLNILEITTKNKHTKPYDPEDKFRFEILAKTPLRKSSMSHIYKLKGYFSIYHSKIQYHAYRNDKFRLAKFALIQSKITKESIQEEYELTIMNPKLSLKKPVMRDDGGFLVMRYINGKTLNYFFKFEPCGLLKISKLNHLDSFYKVKHLLFKNNAVIANQEGTLYFANYTDKTLSPIPITSGFEDIYTTIKKACSKKYKLANKQMSDFITCLTGQLYQLSTLDRLNLNLSLLYALKTQVIDLGIIHRDIKIENMLVCLDLTIHDKTIKKDFITIIIDYGLATQSLENNRAVGTIGYVAPEILFSPHYPTFKSDLFSMGRVIAMLWGSKIKQNQFDEHFYTLENLLENIFSGLTEFSPYMRKKIRHLLENLLEMDPQKRFCVTEAILTLKEIILDHEDELKSHHYQRLLIPLETSYKLIESQIQKIKIQFDQFKDTKNNHEALVEYEKILNLCYFIRNTLENIKLFETDSLEETLKKTLKLCQSKLTEAARAPYAQDSEFLFKKLWKISASLLQLEELNKSTFQSKQLNIHSDSNSDEEDSEDNDTETYSSEEIQDASANYYFCQIL